MNELLIVMCALSLGLSVAAFLRVAYWEKRLGDYLCREIVLKVNGKEVMSVPVGSAMELGEFQGGEGDQ